MRGFSFFLLFPVLLCLESQRDSRFETCRVFTDSIVGIPTIRHHGTGRDGDVVETGDRSRIELTRCPGLDERSLHLAAALRRLGGYKHLLNASSDVHDLNEASNDTKYHTNDVSTHRREPKRGSSRPPLQKRSTPKAIVPRAVHLLSKAGKWRQIQHVEHYRD